MSLGTRAVEVADDGGHAGLVAHGGGEVDGLLGVILREAVVELAVSFRSLRTRTLGNGRLKGDSTYDLTLPRWRAARFRGRNAREPWRGASYSAINQHMLPKRNFSLLETRGAQSRRS